MIPVGLFDNMATKVEDIQVGFRLPEDTYNFVIEDIKMFDFTDESNPKNYGQKAVIVKLTVTEGKQAGKSYDQWLRIPDEELQGTDMAEMFGSILKQNLIAFGVPEDKLSKFDPERHKELLIGNEGTATIKKNKKNPDYDNLYNFTLTEESGVSETSVTPNQTTDEVNTDEWA